MVHAASFLLSKQFFCVEWWRMDIELLKAFKDLSPWTLGLVALIYAIKKIPYYSFKKMQLEAEQKNAALVHLSEQIDTMREDLEKLKAEVSNWQKKFFDLQEEHARLKVEHEQLKGALKAYEQKKAKR
jgi:peptidoglycan hydrolase CwlO-like protein